MSRGRAVFNQHEAKLLYKLFKRGRFLTSGVAMQATFNKVNTTLGFGYTWRFNRIFLNRLRKFYKHGAILNKLQCAANVVTYRDTCKVIKITTVYKVLKFYKSLSFKTRSRWYARRRIRRIAAAKRRGIIKRYGGRVRAQLFKWTRLVYKQRVNRQLLSSFELLRDFLVVNSQASTQLLFAYAVRSALQCDSKWSDETANLLALSTKSALQYESITQSKRLALVFRATFKGLRRQRAKFFRAPLTGKKRKRSRALLYKVYHNDVEQNWLLNRRLIRRFKRKLYRGWRGRHRYFLSRATFGQRFYYNSVAFLGAIYKYTPAVNSTVWRSSTVFNEPAALWCDTTVIYKLGDVCCYQISLVLACYVAALCECNYFMDFYTELHLRTLNILNSVSFTEYIVLINCKYRFLKIKNKHKFF